MQKRENIFYKEKGIIMTGGRARESMLKAGLPALPAAWPSSLSLPERDSKKQIQSHGSSTQTVQWFSTAFEGKNSLAWHARPFFI